MALRTETPGRSPQTAALRYERIVVKASTNVLTRKTDHLDRDAMRSLVDQIADVMARGAQVAFVTSGAVAAGREAAPHVAAGKGVPVSQMLAAIGQSRLMHDYSEMFAERGILSAQALLTGSDVDRRAGYLNVRNTLCGLMERGVIPIINENDVVDTAEITEGAGRRFGDNDSLSAIVANVIEADLLVMMMDTGGLYTADPNRDPSASLIERVDRIDDDVLALAGEHRSAVTRGGMAAKLEATRRATAVGVTVVFAAGADPAAIVRAACGEPVGTLFPSPVSSMEARKRWLRAGMSRKGAALVVDDGAVAALVDGERSLLPAGVREVRGAFSRGDVIEMRSLGGAVLAYGIANYDADELRVIAGQRSARIAELIGHHHGDEAVHRNNLALV